VAGRKEFDPAPLRKIIAEGHRAVHAGVLEHLIELDLAFHNELYRASGNRVALNAMQTQWDHIRRVMTMTLTIRSHQKTVCDKHAAILDAIAQRAGISRSDYSGRHARSGRTFLTASVREHCATQGE
jgi:DNA-binding GntR family transcriptional regulator